MGWTDNSADETGFEVERAGSTSGPWVFALSAGPNQISAVDGGRLSERQACYRVAAVNAAGRSNWSEVACGIPPAPATDLSATGSTASTVDLTWTDNSAVEDGYEIQRATAYDGPYVVIAGLSSNTTAFQDGGLASDQTYWYRVRAKRAGGFSDYSGPVAGVAATTAPVAPTWVSASPFNGSGTFLSWRDNSTNEAGFRLERSDGGGPWVILMTFGAGGSQTLQMWDYGQYEQEVEICYRLVAFNSLGEAAGTGCTALPAVPIDLRASVVDGVVELSWTDNSRFEDGYYIVRADGMSMGFYYVYGAVGPNVTRFRDLSPDPDWASYYLRAMKGPEGYSCCSNAVDVNTPTAP